MTEKRKPYLKLSRRGMGSYIVAFDADAVGENVTAEFGDQEPGDTIELELVMMTDAELAALPEFVGW